MCKVLCQFSETDSIEKDKISLSDGTYEKEILKCSEFVLIVQL